METKIDFVIPWVDGSDPEWRAQKALYANEDPNADGRDARYRDWDNLHYWFRSVETFTPWVNRIHLITWGHLPKWLNTEHPKLNIVRHQDYIPQSYLPTFSANGIELNIHRISGLAEQFVYFNDDMFVLRPLGPEFFFRKGLPCDTAAMNPLSTMELSGKSRDERIFYFSYNDMQYLNRQYSKRECISAAPHKWYSVRYGSFLLRNLLLAAWPRFVGFVDFHLPQAYLKSSFVKAWEDASDILHETCLRPIRTDHDVNQWLIRYRQLAEGRFCPARPVKDASFMLGAGDDRAMQVIRRQEKPMICLNDSGVITQEDYELEKERLKAAFQTILPNPSSFERT